MARLRPALLLLLRRRLRQPQRLHQPRHPRPLLLPPALHLHQLPLLRHRPPL